MADQGYCNRRDYTKRGDYVLFRISWNNWLAICSLETEGGSLALILAQLLLGTDVVGLALASLMSLVSFKGRLGMPRTAGRYYNGRENYDKPPRGNFGCREPSPKGLP